ncbi:MAG: hypothetical protein Q4E47_01340 [Candidatus Saccharibacteria bacterium]|nr:hypothetical protein [Candidatus Saccharibacteria bacterium]
MKNKILLTLLVIIAVAISCAIFFGTGSVNKTELEAWAFGGVILSELVMFISTISIGYSGSVGLGIFAGSAAVIYGTTGIIGNIVLMNNAKEVREIMVFNLVAFLVYAFFAIVCIMTKNSLGSANKKKKK